MKTSWLFVAALGLFSCALAVHAKDLGVQGTVFPIVEIDMRQLMREQLEKVDVQAVQREVKDSAKRFTANLPKRQMPTVQATRTQWLDMSFTLTSAIQAPVKQPDGTWKWQVLYPAGTRVNPLDKHRPTKGMLFVDGSVPEQVAFAQQLANLAKSRLMIVEAGQGDVSTLTKALSQTVFYGDDKLMARFQVTALPALLFAGDGDRAAYMGLTMFSMPFQAAETAQWDALRSRVQKENKK